MKRISAAVALTAVGALAISGCAAGGGDNGDDSGLIEGSSITAAWNQAFYSYNGNTSFGNATANNNITYLTLDGFNYYNNTPELVQNTSFGTYEMVSEDPLTIKYTVNEDVKWSDGTPVDAADLMLDWAALSRALDTPDFDPAEFTDPETGEFTDAFPTDVVYFDSGATADAGLGLVTQTPEIGDDGRSITMTYDQPYVDWELSFPSPLPAHVVAKNALGIEDNEEAKQAILDAIENEDDAALAPISAFWNAGFNFTELPDDPELYLATGPYMISDFVADQYITLVANPEYAGDNQPTIEEITIRFIPDPLAAVQALENGEVDVISPQATADIKTALDGLEGITVVTGVEGTYEHVDLQFNNGRNPENIFSNPQVREAFLKTIPRQEILDTLIRPIAGDDALLRSSQIFVPGADGYDESVAANGSEAFAEVDIEGAKQLLAESGVTNTEVCLLYASNNPRRVNEFALIQASAAQAGFNVTDCGSEQWGGLLGTPGAYDASLFGWQSTSLAVTSSGPTFQTGGINNLTFYSNPEVDELIAQLNVEFDVDAQIDIQKQIDALLWGDFYGVTIFQFPGVTAFSDRVEGIDPSILAPTIFWNAWDWSVTDGGSEE
ncbi:ABC transporter family substrate-binding protein [Microbacterium immunditiarum]|uniref:Peptide/nickel transport system substrate-binding protein n=1 Tax=Microbacterium immunditiarum TaxID=337480 RepID=A0A7Y9GNU0_9MICO|nr:ABC transporter family substrate-binding protein [Microbacterium immunditiarum]NYE19891.1 peptide/nickel transport system substrate-binding protein [Microbacterium immunditiarum]